MTKTPTAEFAFTPHPGKQTEFIASTASNILFGGARGGSKSFSLVYKSAFMVRKFHYQQDGKEINRQDYFRAKKRGEKKLSRVVDKISIDYSDYRAIIIRRTYPDLVKNIQVECEKLYPLYGGIWKERDKCWLFPSGAKIFLNHCTDERALKTYIGLNMHFIGIDEANQFIEEWVDKIAMNLRTVNPELKPQLCLTSNPGDVGHHHLKQNYVDACPPVAIGKPKFNENFKVTYQPKKSGKPFIDEYGVKYQFIPSTVFDNPSILDNDPNYVLKLKKLPPTLRRMWLDGDWDCAPGMYFDNWNIMHHVIPRKLFTYGNQFNKDTHQIYRVFDYGTKAPFVCLFVALDRDGNLIVFDEISESGLSSSKQAKKVVKYGLEKYGLTNADFEENYCDPAYFSNTTEKHGEVCSPADYYEDEGILLTGANNDRKAGAKLVYENLEIPDDDDVPRIRFTDNCTSCTTYIPILPSSKTSPEDVDTKAWDHEYDCVRYISIELLEPKPKEEKKLVMGWREKLKQDQYETSSGNWMSA